VQSWSLTDSLVPIIITPHALSKMVRLMTPGQSPHAPGIVLGLDDEDLGGLVAVDPHALALPRVDEDLGTAGRHTVIRPPGVTISRWVFDGGLRSDIMGLLW
jgi:hypothetical protein